jgi:ribosomal protein S18 acetylase RimI-like enzyme
MSSSLPEGFTLRQARDEDAPAVAELMNAVEAPLGGDAGTTADDVRMYWHESRVWVVEHAGRIVASLETFVRNDQTNADVFVHPAVHGRGLGTALVRLSEADARERGTSVVRNGVLSADDRARELLAREGYGSVRHFYRMKIELDSPPATPQWPRGLRPEPFDFDRDGRAVHAAMDEAFAEEWDATHVAYDEWRERLTGRAAYDPSLWIVVRGGDDVAAATTCETSRFGMGWIASVGVRPPWRRFGLGLAMLYEAFRRFYERGERVVGLGVDAENPTGATRLYERAGMSVAWQATVYEKELA